MSKLDIERFRKLHAHATRNENVGERDNARRMAEALAKKAGLTFDQAASKMDKADKAKSNQGFSAADWARQWADQQEQEQEARKREEEERLAAYWREQEKKRQAQYDEAVRKHGPAEPVFAETHQERRLRIYLMPYAVYAKYSNSDESYVSGFTGDGSKYVKSQRDTFRKILNAAIAFPTDLPGLIDEWKLWEDLRDKRYAYDREYETPRYVYARINALEDMIMVTPIRHWQDMDVRLEWMEAELDRDRWRDRKSYRQEFDRLKADLQFLRRSATPAHRDPGVQTGRRTNNEKAKTVTSILDNIPELSDREISRRAGVSPQTVSNWRARRARI